MTTRSKFPLAFAVLMATTAPVYADDLGGKISGAFTSAYKGLKEGIFDAYEGGTEGAKDAWGTTKTEANKALGNNNSSTASPYPSVRDDLTMNVQTELNAAGYTAGRVDGIYGPQTANAVRAYQGNNGLPQDGQVSVTLLDHMRAKRAGVAPTAAYAPPPAVQPAPITPPPTAGTTAGTTPALPVLPGQSAGQQAAGTPACKPYQTKLMVDGKEQVTQGTACLQADGTWKPMN